MPTRNVVLTPHHEALIERLVSSGRYQNASEVLRAGLRELERHDDEYEAKLAVLRAAIREGEDDIKAGRYVTLRGADDIKAHFRRLTDEALGKTEP